MPVGTEPVYLDITSQKVTCVVIKTTLETDVWLYLHRTGRKSVAEG